MRRAHLKTLSGFAAVAVAAVLTGAWPAGATRAMSPDSAPPLPAPSGSVVNVSTVAGLVSAVSTATSNRTIVLAPGTYQLTSTLWLNGSLSNVTLRGATNNRDDVVLAGQGMGVQSASVPYGIWTGGGVTGLTIANLTIRDIFRHPIMFNAGTESPRIYNVRLLDAGEQFVKSNPDGAGGGVDNGVVEYSVFEYTTTAPNDYTNAVDVHTGRDWIIRHNLFRRIRAPQGQLAGPAILMWNGSTGTLVDGNTFIDCHRDISLGLIDRTPNDHTGGIVRNNFIVRSTGSGGDVAIAVFDSPSTKVVHNTIWMNGQYSNSIEVRFPHATGVAVTNNLSDRAMRNRDGATATVQGNVWTAAAGWFVNTAAGDLHLVSTAAGAIDRGVAVADASSDWDNQSRPQGGVPDAGADEFMNTTPLPDTAAPVVSVSAPAAGATVSGLITLTAAATDNVGVAAVWFTLDGSPVGLEDTSAPFQIIWNTTSVSSGSHQLRAVARDAAGNIATSSPRQISVQNGVSTPANVPGDLNSDGRPDLLFRHTAGQLYAWFIQDASMVGGQAPTPGHVATAWQIVGVDDFNGDLKSDVLWQHETTGQVYLWFMDGTTMTGGTVVGGSTNGWRVRAVGNLDGDGSTDIVLQHPATGEVMAWMMNGTTVAIEGSLTPAQMGTGWYVASAADVNADGRADILWQNRTTGALAVWRMIGRTAASSATLSPGSANPAWRIKTSGDFNHDGSPDLVWQHTQSGHLYIWYLSGTTMVSGRYLTPAQVNPAWQILSLAP